MSRFRYSGVDLGKPWHASKAVESLGEQVETEWPTRRPEDGTAASASHAKWPASDHGPDPDGVVRAIDIGLPPDLFEILRLSLDPRIKYAIHKTSIFSSYPAYGYAPYAVRPYKLGNHTHHTHISMLTIADHDGEPWQLGDDMSEAIAGIQRNLNKAGFATPLLKDDGIWGPKTEAAHLRMVEAAKSPTFTLPDHKHKQANTGGVVK